MPPCWWMHPILLGLKGMQIYISGIFSFGKLTFHRGRYRCAKTFRDICYFLMGGVSGGRGQNWFSWVQIILLVSGNFPVRKRGMPPQMLNQTKLWFQAWQQGVLWKPISVSAYGWQGKLCYCCLVPLCSYFTCSWRWIWGLLHPWKELNWKSPTQKINL